MKAYGAELVLTEGAKGMKGAIAKAEELAKEIPNSFIPGQFVNPANPQAHRADHRSGDLGGYRRPGRYLCRRCRHGRYASPASAEYLKSQESRRSRSSQLSRHPLRCCPRARPVSHKIQGIGAGFVPDVLDTSVYDEIIPVKNEDAFATGKTIGRSEGVLVGISSGAALWAAIELAKRPENKGKTIVALLPDTGDRYLSTALFAD